MVKRVGYEIAWGRLGWLAITFITGAALIAASWANYRSAIDATETLELGHGRVLESAARTVLRLAEDDDVPVQGLEELLDERAEDGLHFIALLDEEGRIAVRVGEAMPDALVDPRRPEDEYGPALVRVGSRIRMFASRRRPGPVLAIPDQMPIKTPRRWGVILEFEPVVASRLRDRATQSLVFGLAAAVLMMVVSAILWRISQRYEQARQHLERERRLSLLGEMAAVLAHEIRNPLASLKGHAQLLAERLEQDPANQPKADLVVREAKRLEALTNDLLDFAGAGPLELQAVQPARLVHASAEEVQSGGFDLDVSVAPERWMLDAPRFEQVLTNVLRNAQQFSPPGKRPAVRVAVEDNTLVVIVRDFGDGLPKGQEERVFDPFFTTRTSGTGLGLAVARRIVELHGGTLTAQNHPDGGAEFRITVPKG